MIIATINKPDKVEFVTVRDSLYNNGERHRINGLAYLIEGNLEYAIGSFRKMLRNYEAAQALTDFYDCGLNDFTDRLAENIARQIINGNGDELL